MPLPWTGEAAAEQSIVIRAPRDALAEPCMGTVTHVDVDAMGRVFWLITSYESENADVVVFGTDLELAGITEGLQVGEFVSYLKVSSPTVFGQALKRATDLNVFKP